MVRDTPPDGVRPRDEGLLKSLHFMMLKHRLDRDPGRWRPGEIFVVRGSTKQRVYEGPPVEQVPELIAGTRQEHERYYEVLGEVGQGHWNPEHDARPWLGLCLTAHYHQARTQLRRIAETERLYGACAEIAEQHGLPDRATGALVEAAHGFRLTHSTYKMLVELTAGETVSSLTASRDLRALVDAKLLAPIGQTRGRYYVGEPTLRAERKRIQAGRVPRESSDPFELATGQLSLALS